MFQTRLRELRESAGYKSQQAFADAFGVAQSTVGGWEAGKREPNYETTMRLARFFDVSVDDLLGLTDERTAPPEPAPPPEPAAPPDPAYLEALQCLEGLSGEALASALRCLQAIKALDDAKAPADAAVILEKNA
ncbi:helix-turn-helix transcriptional regulator [Anaerotruncus colihominis]|uniref:helix-turn-helix transcriptional regulator n=1 Tax=Anaerotruncus colihominis TaxID=169435 RepID=UPI0026ED2FB2|nr:helix-turn-helix transcriptional regulator [Anaerotruncus colihominis]